MSAEIFASRDKEVKKKTEEERKESIRQTMEFTHEKKELTEKNESRRKFNLLKSMIERHLLTPETFNNLSLEDAVENNDTAVREVLKKIDEIESLEWIDNILPKKLRVTIEEYVHAQKSEESRVLALQKIDMALRHLYLNFNPEWSLSFLFFQFMLLSFQKQAKIVQEHTVDIRKTLLVQNTTTP